jgi:ATP-dependent DNA helicase RecG
MQQKPAAASGPRRAMQKLGLVRDIDLALHLPLRWEDETTLVPLHALREGQVAQVEAAVASVRVEERPRRQLLVTLRSDDGLSAVVLRFLHFHPMQAKGWPVGRRLRARGEVRGGFFGREIVHPVVRAVAEGEALPAALTPVYPAAAGLPQAYLRKAVAAALARVRLPELVPAWAMPAGGEGWPPLAEALRWLHAPPPGTPPAALEDRQHPAWLRLKFEELLAQQLAQAAAHAERAGRRAPRLVAATGARVRAAFEAALPFALTAAQAKVVAEIDADLAREQPMHRLLQGDVGSGKTVVAALAAARAIDAGWQGALMAPTEILAEQHFRKLVAWLEPAGARVAWLTGHRKGRARQQALAAIEAGEANLVIGTHAVIQGDVRFARLGLAVVDEQHRFGVAQRLALRQKLGSEALEPHLLMMSATPIPRTLAMSFYADLDVSTIDELPPGRTPVVTKLFDEKRRPQVLARIAAEVARGRQVYWVCPLVEESEALDLQDATATHAELAAALPGTPVGLVHGRLPAAEKAAVMEAFTQGRTPVLVATTVIEVGVDVPSASLMVVEHAERFGLAQLHQLRGRIGRGAAASVCVLLYAPPLSPTAKERLKALAETNDGFEIARRDLAIRGPGEFIGERQSGQALLRFADLDADAPLLEAARATAPRLLAAEPGAARAIVERWVRAGADLTRA